MLKLDRLENQIFFGSLLLTYSREGKTYFGTGFLYDSGKDDSGRFVFLVSNRHVLSGAESILITFCKQDQGSFLPGKTFKIQLNIHPDMVFEHPDPNVDVAIVPLAVDYLRVLDTESVLIRTITKDNIPGQEELESFTALEEVVFVGYPNGYGDFANNLPIARKGTTATPLSVDFDGQRKFLIDASVFPGSSGSPVYLIKNVDMRNARMPGAPMVAQRITLLGIVSAVLLFKDDGTFEQRAIPTAFKHVPVFNEKMDLGIVEKSDTILDCVAVFQKWHKDKNGN